MLPTNTCLPQFLKRKITQSYSFLKNKKLAFHDVFFRVDKKHTVLRYFLLELEMHILFLVTHVDTVRNIIKQS